MPLLNKRSKLIFRLTLSCLLLLGFVYFSLFLSRIFLAEMFSASSLRLLALGQFQEARLLAQKSVNLSPKEPTYLRRFLQTMESPDVSLARKAIDLNPDNLTTTRNLVREFVRLDPSIRLQYATWLADKYPADVGVQVDVVRLLLSADDPTSKTLLHKTLKHIEYLRPDLFTWYPVLESLSH